MHVRFLGWEDPWGRAWQPTPVFLPGESHGQSSLVSYSPWVAQSWTRQATQHTYVMWNLSSPTGIESGFECGVLTTILSLSQYWAQFKSCLLHELASFLPTTLMSSLTELFHTLTTHTGYSVLIFKIANHPLTSNFFLSNRLHLASYTYLEHFCWQQVAR